MYAMRFTELVVWMWEGQAHVGARGISRFLLSQQPIGADDFVTTSTAYVHHQFRDIVIEV